MKKIITSLPTVTPLNIEQLRTRDNASAGLWLIILLPLACSPGLYETYSHCTSTPKLLALLSFQLGVSGIHLYHKFCVSQKTQITENDGCQISRFSRTITHPYIPALVTAAAVSILTDISPLVALVTASTCLWIMYNVTPWLFRKFPGSFSLGEGALLGQAASLSVTFSLYNVIRTLVNQQRLSEVQEISTFVQTAILVVSLCIVGLYKVRLFQAPRIFLPYICLCGVGGVIASSLIMGQWSPLWLLEMITSNPARQTLMIWWLLLTVFSVILTIVARRTNKLPTTVLRKVYHLVVVLVFTPGIIMEPAFTHLAATAAIMFCCLLECVRDLKIEPIASVVFEAFAVFLDEKDTGSLILSHVYLAAGVASPLWLAPCPLTKLSGLETAGTLLPLMAGILAVGIGDTAASVGGTYLGRRHWSGTKKTVEGSLCGIGAQLLMVGLLVSIGTVKMSFPAWGRLFISTVVVAVVEALTDQVDNIVLPLLMYTPLMDL